MLAIAFACSLSLPKAWLPRNPLRAGVQRLPKMPRNPLRRRNARDTGVPASSSETELIFAGQPASTEEMALLDEVAVFLAKARPDFKSNWLKNLTRTDLLRYARAVAADGSVSADIDAVATRILKTAEWREQEDVDGLFANAADVYALDRFFEKQKDQSESDDALQEAYWLDGSDRLNRPVSLFVADRHRPGEISIEEWKKLVLYNGELAIKEMGVAEGPHGQFTLIVDRSKSSIANQDPGLALELLPELMDHYPELLGSVIVAPVNSIFWSVWRLVRLFISERTAAKFVLLRERGGEWREELQQLVGPDVALPEHLLPGGGGDLAEASA